MLVYEYRTRTEFDRLKEYARSVREKLDAGASADDLLRDAANLEALYNISESACAPSTCPW